MSKSTPKKTGVAYLFAIQSSVCVEKLKVLLVEDDEVDAFLIQSALATNPRVAEVVLAQNGVEALELIDRGAVKPDLAFIDLRVSRKNGFALLRDLATRDSARSPPLVPTSSTAGEDTARSKKRGAGQIGTKPRTEQRIAAALDRVIAMI